MVGFNSFRIVTSHVRWAASIFQFFLFRGPVLLVSPPMAKRQIIFLRKHLRKPIRLLIASYFDWATVHEVFVGREYALDRFPQADYVERTVTQALSVGKIPLILDLGANIGVASTFFSCEYPNAKIIAVEPSSANQVLLNANVDQIANSHVILAAVGPEDREIELIDPGLGNNAFRTFGSGAVIGKVQQVTVQELLKLVPQNELVAVKIDIEGFEAELFKSNCDWIDRAKLIVIETHDWMLPGQALSQNLINALAGRNRDLVFRGENLFSIRND